MRPSLRIAFGALLVVALSGQNNPGLSFREGFVALPDGIRCNLTFAELASSPGHPELGVSGPARGLRCWYWNRTPSRNRGIDLTDDYVSDGLLSTKELGKFQITILVDPVEASKNGGPYRFGIEKDKTAALIDYLGK